MRCVVAMNERGHYLVQIYKQFPHERMASWHTLRVFVNQGDAFLFRDMLNANRTIDVDLYVKTNNNKQVVTSMRHGMNGRPKLITKTI